MKTFVKSLKKVSFFALGSFLLLTGGQAGARTTEKAPKEKSRKAADTDREKDAGKADRKTDKKPRLEKKWPENASGSE